MNLEDRIQQIGQTMLDHGYSVIPMGYGKSPIISWKEHIDKPLEKWDFTRCNIAMLTGTINGYVVIDCDSTESYIGWLKHRPQTPLRVRSRKGMHFYYRHPGGYVKSGAGLKAAEGFSYDVKGDRSYCVMPPSLSKGHQYQVCVCSGNIKGAWIHSSKLPVFDIAWRPETRKTSCSSGGREQVRDVDACIQKTIFAAEGERDKATFRVAMICKENGLSEGEAIQTTINWHNTNCSPPWTAEEIVEKVVRVYGRS